MVGPKSSAASRAQPISAAIAANPESAATAPKGKSARLPNHGARTASLGPGAGVRPNRLKTSSPAATFAATPHSVDPPSPSSGMSSRAAATLPARAPAVFAA